MNRLLNKQSSEWWFQTQWHSCDVHCNRPSAILHSPTLNCCRTNHYDDVIMTTMASQITSLTIVYSIVYSDADQRKHQSSASLAFVWGIHRGPVNSPHKWPVTRKMFPFDDVIMRNFNTLQQHLITLEHSCCTQGDKIMFKCTQCVQKVIHKAFMGWSFKPCVLECG